MDDENTLSADPRNRKREWSLFCFWRNDVPFGGGFWTRRGGSKARGRRGFGPVRENPGEREAGGPGNKKTSSQETKGEEPGGEKDEEDGCVDVRFTMYPVARSRGKVGVEGDGQWKVTVLVTWLSHGLAL